MARTLINAHRGDPIRFRENTMPAFDSAVKLGADCIELDIHGSLDGRPVVLHDATLERLWGIQASVSNLTYDRILEMTKDADMYVPRLEEVLDSFWIPVMIDFGPDTAVEPIVRAIAEQRATDRCIISSGNIPALMALRQSLNDVTIALTWNDIIPPSQKLLQELDVQYFNPNYRIYQDEFIAKMSGLTTELVSGERSQMLRDALEKRGKHPEWYALDSLCGSRMVQMMHDSDRKTCAWTVDEPAIMVELMNLGLDMVTTNDVRTMVEAREPYGV